jgi:hypothetical protein
VKLVKIVDDAWAMQPSSLSLWVNTDNVCLLQDADPADQDRGFLSELTHSGGKQLFRMSPEELAQRLTA